MRRRAFLLAGLLLPIPAALGAKDVFSRGLLWRVTHKGVAPSHVYGTIHVADPRLAELPRPVHRAFAEARSLMLEFVGDSYSRERFTEAAMYMDQRTLEQEIGKEDFERAVERMKLAGLERDFVNKMKPWGVLINLRTQKDMADVTLDQRLVQMAQARRMPMHQIEGVEEQVFTFDEFPMASQVALLRHSLSHADELLQLAERTLQAYIARDLAGIWRLREEFNARHPDIAPHQAVMTKRVVHDRSVVMAYRMQRELRRGNALVALGALHLYGNKGVLALLEQDGFRAARVY